MTLRKKLKEHKMLTGGLLILFICIVSLVISSAFKAETPSFDKNDFTEQSLTAECDGATITVSGLMPQNSTLKVNLLDSTNYISLLQNAVEDRNLKANPSRTFRVSVIAFDNEYQPEEYNELLNIKIEDTYFEQDRSALSIHGDYIISKENVPSNIYVSTISDGIIDFYTDKLSVFSFGELTFDTTEASHFHNDVFEGYYFLNTNSLVITRASRTSTSVKWGGTFVDDDSNEMEFPLVENLYVLDSAFSTNVANCYDMYVLYNENFIYYNRCKGVFELKKIYSGKPLKSSTPSLPITATVKEVYSESYDRVSKDDSSGSSLEKIYVPNTSEIKLKNFKNLKEVYAPKAKCVSSYGFYNSAIEKISLPEVERIYEFGFSGCRYLKQVYLPNLTLLKGGSVFSSCTSLEEITLPKLISDGTYLPTVFAYCTNLKKIHLPLCDKIDYRWFKDCISLTEVSIPCAYMVGKEAFVGCASLEKVIFPNVTTVYNNAFDGCRNLKKVYMPLAGELKYESFINCSSLKNLVFPNLTSSSDSYAFKVTDAIDPVDSVFYNNRKLWYSSSSFNGYNSSHNRIYKTADTCYTIKYYLREKEGNEYQLIDFDYVFDADITEFIPTEAKFDGFKYDNYTTDLTNNSAGFPVNEINCYYTGSTSVLYVVNHHKQKIDSGEYDLADAERCEGVSGESITPATKTYKGFTAPSTQSVTIAGDGSTVVNYYYTRNSYKLSLQAGTGIDSVSGGGTYKYESEVTIGATPKAGYHFKEWKNGDTQTSTSASHDVTVTEALTLTAEAEVIPYSITLNLNGGAYEVGESNPISYTVESASFTLVNPKREGYIFKGWTATADGTEYQSSFSIPKGSTGDINLYAHWTANADTTYVVKHYKQNLSDGNYTLTDTENLTGTTGESITPAVKTYTGFTAPSTQSVTIAGDGSTVVEYQYTRNSYGLTLNAGTGIESVSGAGTYKYESVVSIEATPARGYRFGGWDNGSIIDSTDSPYTITLLDDATFTATAEIIKYNITLDLNGGHYETGKESPATYTVESDLITLNSPVKAGYTFKGWTITPDGTDCKTSYTIAKGSTGDIILYAHWTANTDTTYVVKHYKENLSDGNYTLADTENLTGTTGENITPAVKTYTGFTAPSTQTVTIVGNGSTVVEYQYTRNSYAVTLNAGTGIESVSGAGTYKYESEVTIGATPKTGYRFKEWKNGDTQTSTSASHDVTVTEALTLTAEAEVIPYSITLNLDGGAYEVGESNPISYTVESASFTLVNPIREGYIFKGWTATADGTEYQTSYSIPKGSTGNVSLYANWTANTDTAYVVKHYKQNLSDDNYTLTDTDNLKGTTDSEVTPATKTYTGFTAPSTQTVTIAGNGSTVVEYQYTRNSYAVTLNAGTGIESVSGAGTYKYESEVTIDATPKAGYRFIEWKNGGKQTSTSASYKVQVTGETTLSAVAEAIKYGITINLGGGVYPTGEDNVTIYTVEEDITLKNPVKEGYTFRGWTTTADGTDYTETYTIAKGSTGNLSLYAHWTANTDTAYVVKHYKQNLSDDNYTLTDTDNLTGTTDSEVTPATKTYTGFTAPSTQSVTIAGDGSTVVEYQYTRNSYAVTLNAGTGIESVSGAGTYKYESEVTIGATPKTGYRFKEWKSGDTQSSTNASYDVTITKDLTLTAEAEVIKYGIALNLNDGAYEEGIDNPTSYTVESDSFTLVNPKREGYTFTGWTATADGTEYQTSYSIPKGSTGNVSLYANWTANTDTAYVVKHYKQNLSDDNYTLTDTDNLTGTTDSEVTPATKTYTGFTAPSTQSVTIAGDGSTVVEYQYTRNSYGLTLNAGTGIESVSGAGTYKYESAVTIGATPKAGYHFKEWKSGDTQSSTSASYDVTITKDLNLTAEAEAIKYNITLNLNGGAYKEGESNPTAYTVESDAITLTNPVREGYSFRGWTVDGAVYQTTYIIAKGSTGGVRLNAGWVADEGTSYTVNHYKEDLHADTYSLVATENLAGTTGENITPAVKSYTGFTAPSTQSVTIAGDGSTVVNYYYDRNLYELVLIAGTGIERVSGAGTYEYESDMTIGATPKTGYRFKEWKNGDAQSNTSASYDVTITKDLTLTAEAEAIKYGITINLGGGAYPTGEGNVTIYTVEEDITLKNPVKAGYTFKGWTTTADGTDYTETYTIAKGSTGNISLYAHWTANTDTAYVVKHYKQNLSDDNYTLTDTENLTGTTDSEVTPATKTYTGFTAPSTQSVTIAGDGSTVVEYQYTRNSYAVTLNAGTGIASVSGAGTYKYESEVTVDATPKAGYRFKEWENGDSQSSASNLYKVQVTGATTLSAFAEAIEYSITINLGGGVYPTGEDNITIYTVEEDITLNNPVRSGYAFVGWKKNGDTGEATKTMRIEKGTTGNLAFTAVWESLDKTAPQLEVMDNKPTGQLFKDASKRVTLTAFAHDDVSADNELLYQFMDADGTVLADWQEDNHLILYPINGNGTYIVKVKDTAGNVATKEYILTAWDLEAPKLTVKVSPERTEEPYVQERTVTALADDNSAGKTNVAHLPEKPYYVEEKTYNYQYHTSVSREMEKEFTQTLYLTAGRSGTYVIYARDTAGNLTHEDVVIQGIDTLPPEVDYFTQLSADNKSVIVGIKAKDAYADRYSEMSGLTTDESGAYTCFSLSDKSIELGRSELNANGWVYSAFQTTKNVNLLLTVQDKAGNSQTCEIRVNADRIREESAYNPIEDILLTNSDESIYPACTGASVTAEIVLLDRCAESDYAYCFDYRGYVAGKKDNGTGTWASGRKKTFYANGTYHAYIKDEFGFVYEKTFEIKNIDRTKPVIQATGGNDGSIRITVTDNLSGLDYIRVTGNSLEQIKEYRNLNGVLSDTEVYTSTGDGGTFQIVAYDMAGNASSPVKVFVVGKNAVQEESIKLKVTFRNYRNVAVKTVTVDKYGKAVAPKDTQMRRSGYLFAGWDTSFERVEQNLSVRPVYVEDRTKEGYFMVVFKDSDGTVLKAENVARGSEATPPSAPEKEGKTFIGWSSTAYQNVQGNTILVAQYR